MSSTSTPTQFPRWLLASALGFIMVIATGLQSSAAPVATVTPASAAATVASAPTPETMTPEQYQQLKAGLSASKAFTKSESTSGGVRTLSFQYTNGTVLTLQEPVSGPPTVTTSIRVGGCGFLQLCVYLNRTDQGALAAGGAAGLAIAICAIPAVGTAACAFVAAALTAAAYYIAAHGFCKKELRVRIFPSPGKLGCV